MADLIKQSELKDRMKKIPEWELEKNQIERTFEFDDFVDAIDFVDRVAEVAGRRTSPRHRYPLQQGPSGAFNAQQRRLNGA